MRVFRHKIGDLAFRVCVVEAQHLLGMPHGLEPFDRLAAHAARRRVRIGKRREPAFEVLEFAEEPVELKVCYLGPRLDVIEPVVAFDLGREGAHSLSGLFVGHRIVSGFWTGWRQGGRTGTLNGGICGTGDNRGSRGLLDVKGKRDE